MRAFFVDREPLFKLLDDNLLPSTKSDGTSELRSFALCGAAGVGKSVIAKQYMHTRGSEFDAVFSISAEDSFKIADAFSKIAVQLQLLTPSQSKDHTASRITVMNWLSCPYSLKTPTDTAEEQNAVSREEEPFRWLLIFDNVESVTLLKEYIPQQGRGSILLTSRDQVARHYLSPTGAGADLSPPTVDEALEVLHWMTRPHLPLQEEQAAFQLIKRLGRSHIAVQHVAGVINIQGLTLEEALSTYESDLPALRDGKFTCSEALPTAWALMAVLPTALALLRVISLLDRDAIPESLLESDEGCFEEYPLASEFGVITTMLNTANLLSQNKTTKAVSVHRVVRDVTRQMMSADEFVESFQLAITLLASHWNDDRYFAFGRRLEAWEVANIAVPHVSRLVSHFERYTPKLSFPMLETFVTLVTRASIHLKDYGNWDRSISLADLALRIVLKHKPGMAEQHADILMCLSSICHCLGEREKGLEYAQAHFKQRILVEDSKPPAEQDGAFRAMAYTELALGLVMNGEYEGAITVAEQGRKLLEETPEFLEGDYWPHWADYHHAWALIGLDRAAEACPILEEMLEWRRKNVKNYAIESIKTAYTIQILGVAKEKAGRTDEAILNWEQALFLYEKVEGDSSFRTNQVRIKLGEHYGKQGKAEAAAKMFTTALQYFTGAKYYKAERARTLFKQSEFLSSIGDLDGAAKARSEAEDLYFEICPEQFWGDDATLTAEDFDDIVMIMSR